jgi:hypothetical protein
MKIKAFKFPVKIFSFVHNLSEGKKGRSNKLYLFNPGREFGKYEKLESLHIIKVLINIVVAHLVMMHTSPEARAVTI